jgi:P pilus assembly chaperone PapD
MERILTIRFQLNGSNYYSVVRIIKKQDCTEYHITVTDLTLNRKLNGNHVMIEREGEIEINICSQDTEQGRLRLEIANTLGRHLKTLSQQEILTN